MSATVKLSSKLPGDEEINGLDHIVEDLMSSTEPVVVIAWVVPTKITEDIETGARVPTVEVRRVEPIGHPREVSTEITNLAAELYEKRTGRNPLPIDVLLAPKGDVDELDDRRGGEPESVGQQDLDFLHDDDEEEE